jgi:hypothetical protein
MLGPGHGWKRKLVRHSVGGQCECDWPANSGRDHTMTGLEMVGEEEFGRTVEWRSTRKMVLRSCLQLAWNAGAQQAVRFGDKIVR